jgi:hypothetical protein
MTKVARSGTISKCIVYDLAYCSGTGRNACFDPSSRREADVKPDAEGGVFDKYKD